MPDRHDCGADVGAYALGALAPEEADAFRRHLAACAVCQDELASLEQAVDMLALAADQSPAPRGLRRRVMRATRAERRSGARRGLWLPRPALAVGLACIAAAGAVVGVTLPGGPGPRVINASVVGVSGSAQLRVTGGQAVLVVSHFQPPGAGHIYEVWLERDGQPPAATSALFSVTSSGAGEVGVPGSLRGISAVLVTPEPAGGRPHPTHAPVIIAKL